jgi:ABC-type Fe3+-hydroxamate transport system substrate-binding protein
LRGDPVPADTKRKEIDVWRALASLPAVRRSRVYFLDDQRTVVPGPRVAEGIELIARTLHPEVFK